MKRIISILLCTAFVLCLACTRAPKTDGPTAEATGVSMIVVDPVPETTPAVQETEAPAADTPAPEPTAEVVPDLSMLPISFRIDWDREESRLITFDIDFDGEEETISYSVDKENGTTTIFMDDQPLVFTESCILEKIIFIDLDPETPWANMLVTIDWASDDYVTTEVHPENGTLVKGVEREYITLDEDGTLISFERTDLLGTKDGWRHVIGEQLEAKSEWLACDPLTKNDLTVDREWSIELGKLLHATRDIECTIDGAPAVIPTGSYVYMLRFNEARTLVEVQIEGGSTAMLSIGRIPDEWTYLIAGVPQDDCFDNIFYAD